MFGERERKVLHSLVNDENIETEGMEVSVTP